MDTRLAAFSVFIPTSSQILRGGRAFVECYDAYENFSSRWDDYTKRLSTYEAITRRQVGNPYIYTRIYFTDTGPKLVAEGNALRAEGDGLEGRCSVPLTIELDQAFITFMRTFTQA